MADIVIDSANEILERAIETLENSSVLNRTSPGSKLRVLLSIMAQELERTQEVAQANAVLALTGGATGPFLDYLGEIVGVSRQPYGTASVDAEDRSIVISASAATFGDMNDGQSIIIPAGTILKSLTDNISYRISSRVVLASNASTAYAGASALTGGPSANVSRDTLTSLEFTAYSGYPGETLLVTNTSAIQSGSLLEPDAAYRFRIMQGALSGRGSNFTAIRVGLLALPGVDDVRVIDLARGVGTADVLVETSSAELSRRLRTQAEIRLSQVKALGMDIAILTPVFVGLKMSLEITGGVGDFKQRQIRSAIRNQIQAMASSLRVGAGLSINQLAAAIIKAHPEITDIGSPGEPIKSIHLFRESPFSGRRSGIAVPGDIEIAEEERLVLEGAPSEAIEISFIS